MSSASPLETAARIGYAFKGVLYVLLGVLAVQASLGEGSSEGQTGALRTVADSPFGGVLLAALAVGLGAYALWRLATAVLDPENHGTDASGIVHRVGYFGSALAYGFFAFVAGRLVWGGGGSEGSGGGASEQAQTALGLPGGRWLVVLAAIALLGFAAREAYRAYTASFMDGLSLGAAKRSTVKRLGQAGLAARAVVYGVMGISLASAAWQSDASEAVGLDGALAALRDQPYGLVLLGAVGLGLAAYGLYCGVNARYRHFEEAS